MNIKNRSLEGLRGAAAVLVVLFHMGTLSRYVGAINVGYLAVDLFFVLSGFVISSAYSARLSSTRDVQRFIVRRIGRLWPLHLTANALYLALASIPALLTRHSPFAQYDLTGLVALALMAQSLNLFDHFVGLTVSWSTSDEFYIYLLFAAVCLFLPRIRIASFTVLCGLGFVAALWIQTHSVAYKTCSPYPFFCMTNSYGWLRCMTGFFAGSLLFEFRSHLRFLTAPRVQVFIFVMAIAFLDTSSRLPAIALFAPIMFSAAVASLMEDDGPVARVLQTRGMQYLGSISYALYLSHAVCLIFLLGLVPNDADLSNGARQIISSGAFLFSSFALAHLLHRYVEVPCRNRFCKWADRLPAEHPRVSRPTA